ncbi:predicted protein [Naegleria gruberi]|uniref:Predicted protein n=1 Tax=Naegleria gruberi TaxID=5762 RepID=D2VWE1_NAEGR|nr:uncharacterized protein NAEGRDRAFT_81474 [Naegleria gruberi]EFC38820.1 predicted protein [Naegleria gruberi]|eukprot:XP_002671564.1 predicted protein [Naegleria gruberi strain NEG-M]
MLENQNPHENTNNNSSSTLKMIGSGSVQSIEKSVFIDMDTLYGKEQPFVLLEKLDGSLCSPIIERVVSESDASSLNSSLKKNNFASVSAEKIEKRAYDTFRLRMRTKLSHTNAIVMGMEELIYDLGDEGTRRNAKGEDIKLILNDHLKNVPTFEYKTSEMTKEEEEYLVFKIDEQALEIDANFTQLSEKVQNFIRFCIHWINKGFTPLFEFFSKEHKIVIDYGDKPFLSLLALRHTVDGYFLPYSQVKKSAQQYGIDCVKECSNEQVIEAAKTGDMDEILKAIRNERGVEGYVLVLNNGWMFKVKSMWYNNIHKTNGFISKGELKESRIWQYCFDSKIDDVIGFVRRDEDRIRLQEFNDTVINALNNYVSKVQQFKEIIQLELQKEFPNTPIEEIPMKDYSRVAKQVIKDEPNYVFTALVVNKKDQTSLSSLIKEYCSRNVVNQLGSIKNMLGCQDIEFISRSEINRRAKLQRQKEGATQEEEVNQEEDEDSEDAAEDL